MPTLEIIDRVDHADAGSYVVEIPVDPDGAEFADSALIAATRVVFPGRQVTPTMEAALLLGLL